MSMFTVWLLFVFLPSLSPVLIFILTLASILFVISFPIYITFTDLRVETVLFVTERNTKLNKEGDIMFIGLEVTKQEKIKYRPLLIKIYKWTSICILSFPFLLAAIPSKKEVAAMIVIPYISDSPEFKSLPSNISKYLNDLIKEETTNIVKGGIEHE